MLSRFVVSQVKHNSYFLVGLSLGLWLALLAAPLDDAPEPCLAAAGAARAPDAFAPVREQKPLGAGGAAPGAARSLQRPRYYSTELGMRAPLLAGVLTSEDALGTRVAALNRTVAQLQPALRFFITASTLQGAPSLANVVGFTDKREMLKPFHALKYLADYYLEEYDFFFLVSDTSFVNAKQLTDLVSKLSVSQDVYMGTVAEDDSHYCTLEGGILLSNSVLRAMHGTLDWCVRNSYSPRHHENIGRCVLHAAHVTCASSAQGQSYEAAALPPGPLPLRLALADAVTVQPLLRPEDFDALRAYVARVHLESAATEVRRLKTALRGAARRHPPGFRNRTWPAGLRDDPGLAPVLPDNRWDHLRWTAFNATHALMPDDHRVAAPLSAAHREAVQLVTRAACAWALRRGRSERVAHAALLHGAWRWEPSRALRYRLLLRLALSPGDLDADADPEPAFTYRVQQVEVVRALGAARLVPVPYVTESAQVHALLPVGATADDAKAAKAFLRRWDALCLQRNANAALTIVILQSETEDEETTREMRELRVAAATLAGAHSALAVQAIEGPRGAQRPDAPAARAAMDAAAASGRFARDALVLLLDVYMDFNDDFLNRVRMNTIQGQQWFAAGAFRRYALLAHPLFVDAKGAKPQLHTGRFARHDDAVLAFYRSDYDAALAAWRAARDDRSAAAAAPAALLGAAPLRALRAPEPALLRLAPPPPCALPRRRPSCLRELSATGFARLHLGAPHALAKLLLELQADAAQSA